METTNKSNTTNQKQHSKLQKVFVILFIVHIFLNLFGSPLIKFNYIGIVITLVCMIFVYDPEDVLPYFFPFAMIEGQGRVIWEYATFSRIIFDVLLLFCAIRTFYIRKKLIDTKDLPNYVYLLIFLHFGWYLLQLFNPNSVGIVGTLAATKIYIVPFFIFFSFIINDGLKNLRFINKLENLVILTLITQAIIIIVQFNLREEFLFGIHPYYQQVVKDVFIGVQFRPFGTTFLPGAYAVYFMCLLPLIFLRKTLNRKYVFLKLITIILSFYALFLSQVRSGMIKTFLCVVIIMSLQYIRGKKRFKTFIKFSIFMTLVIIGSNFIDFSSSVDDQQTAQVMARFTSIFDEKTLKNSRLGPSKIFSLMFEKLEDTPLGLGPGRTGAASSLSTNIIKNDPIYGFAQSWSYDNLYFSLAVDLGIGMVFYTLIILLVPIKLFNYCLRAYAANDESFLIITVSAVVTSMLILGNWGAVGLPYNPESFLFWFLAALGFKNVKRKAID